MKLIIRYFLLLILLFFFVRTTVQAQFSVDSILLLADKSIPEKRITHYFTISDFYINQNPKLALKYSNEALALANSLEDDELISEAFKKIGAVYLQMKKFNFAEKYFKQAQDIYVKNKNKRGIADINRFLGTLAADCGDLDKAKTYYDESISIATGIYDTSLMIRSSVLLGNVWMKNDNYEQALRYYNSALVLQENNKCCIEEEARIYNNLGVLFSEQGKYTKSLHYYKQAAVIYDSLDNQFDLGKTYNNIGNIYWCTENYETAQLYYNKSLNIRHEQNDDTGEAYVLNNLGMLSGSRGDFVSAADYFEKSLELFERQKNRNGILLTTYNLGEVYAATHQFQKAEKHYYQSLAIAQEDGAFDDELDNLRSLTDLYKENKDYKKAFEVFDRYVTLKDSLRKYSNTNQMIELEARFDKEKKKTTLAFLQQKIDKEKKKASIIYWSMGLIILLFVSGITALFLIFRKQNLKAVHQKYLLSQQFLQYQMNPNFLHQSLNYIRDFLYKNKTQEAGIYLSNFARLIRTFIEHSTSEEINLETELETVEHYFKLRQAGYETAFSYKIEIDEELEPEFIQLPPFLLFPFIDILLGRFGLSDTLNIKLQLKASEKYLLYNTYIDFSGSHFLDIDDLRQTLEVVSESAEIRMDLIYKLTKKKIELNYNLEIKKANKNLLLLLKVPLSS